MSLKHTPGKLTADGLEAPAMVRLQLTPERTQYTTALVAWMPDGHGREQAVANAERLTLCWNTHDDLVAALAEVIYTYDVVDPRDDDSGYELQVRMADIMEQVREAHAVAKGEG